MSKIEQIQEGFMLESPEGSRAFARVLEQMNKLDRQNVTCSVGAVVENNDVHIFATGTEEDIKQALFALVTILKEKINDIKAAQQESSDEVKH